MKKQYTQKDLDRAYSHGKIDGTFEAMRKIAHVELDQIPAQKRKYVRRRKVSKNRAARKLPGSK